MNGETALVHSIKGAVLWTDSQGRVRHANKAWRSWFKASKGERCFDFVPLEAIPTVCEALYQVSTRGVWQGQVTSLSQDRPQRVNLQLRTFNGGILWFATDSGQIGDERSGRGAVYRAAAAERVASMAHDLGNIIAAIRFGLAGASCSAPDLLPLSLMTERAADLLERIQCFGEELADGTARFNLHETIRAACEIGRMFEGGTSRLTLAMCEGRFIAAGDELALCQAIINLVKNGLEASPSATVSVALDRAPPAERPDWSRLTLGAERAAPSAWVSVEDNAGGVDPSELVAMVRTAYSTKRKSRAGRRGYGYSALAELAARGAVYAVLEARAGLGMRIAVQVPLEPG